MRASRRSCSIGDFVTPHTPPMKRSALVFIALAVFAGSAAFTVTQDGASDTERLVRVANCLERNIGDARKLRCVRRAMDGYATRAPAESPAPSVSPSPSVDAPPSVSPPPSPSPDPSTAPAKIPPATNGDTRGKSLRFSIECDPGKIEQIDPLVSPGKLSAHLHNFFGNAGVTANREPVDAIKNRGTTCRFSKDTGGYWAPLLFDRNGNALPIEHVLVYYRHTRKGGVDPHVPDTGLITQRHEWMCTDGDTFSSPPDCRGRKNNPHGAGIRFIFEPSQLPNGQWTPRVAYNVRYGVDNLKGVFFHTGVSPHADFWNSWHQDAYTALVDRCLDPNKWWRSYTTAQWEDRCSKVTDADFALGN